jgi:serine protease Do
VADGLGVYVTAVPTDGGAAKAGLKKGDVITKINGNPVSSGLEMSGQIASYKPGDQVAITYIRNNKELTSTVILKETPGELNVVANANLSELIGAELETLSKAKASSYDLEGGVVVKKIKDGGLISRTRMQEGFIITSVNGNEVKNTEELTKVLSGVQGTARLEGIYPGYDGTYAYPLNLDDN